MAKKQSATEPYHASETPPVQLPVEVPAPTIQLISDQNERFVVSTMNEFKEFVRFLQAKRRDGKIVIEAWVSAGQLQGIGDVYLKSQGAKLGRNQ